MPSLAANTANVILLGVGFSLLFVAFRTTQEFFVNIVGTQGSTFLSIIYLGISLSNFFAPLVVSYVGDCNAMVASSFSATLFVGNVLLAQIFGVNKFIIVGFYCTSVLWGLSAAVLWVAQGSYLTACSTDETRGRFAGLFWALFQLSHVVGNLVVVGTTLSGDSRTTTQTIFFVMLFVSLGANLWLLLLTRIEVKHEVVDMVNVVSVGETIWHRLTCTVRMYGKTDMLLLSPLIFYSGLTLSFYNCVFGHIVSGSDVTVRGGLAFVCLGSAEVIGGMCLGRLSDAVGRGFVLCFSFLCHAAAIPLLYYLSQLDPDSALAEALCYIVGALIGLGDSGFNTQILGVLSSLFTGPNVKPAFACFKLTQSLAPTCGFFMSCYTLSVFTWTLVMSSFLCVSSVFYAVVVRRLRQHIGQHVYFRAECGEVESRLIQ